ncbi:hypothetical protein ABT398_37340, partial [Streptomyces hydrogenans]
QAHRPATFAAVLGLTRAASAAGDFWVQSDFCAERHEDGEGDDDWAELYPDRLGFSAPWDGRYDT